MATPRRDKVRLLSCMQNRIAVRCGKSARDCLNVPVAVLTTRAVDSAERKKMPDRLMGSFAQLNHRLLWARGSLLRMQPNLFIYMVSYKNIKFYQEAF